jgi:Pectate lyase superfamily protein
MCAYANVREFGAHDGRPDARPAIQKAIDYVVNEGGGEVFFPKGVYIIGTPNPEPRTATNHPLIIRNEKKEVKLRLIGEGMGETFLRLCDEANVLWPGYDARSADTNPQCGVWVWS